MCCTLNRFNFHVVVAVCGGRVMKLLSLKNENVVMGVFECFQCHRLFTYQMLCLASSKIYIVC